MKTEIKNTGIYMQFKWSASDPAGIKETLERWKQSGDLPRHLDQIEADAIAVITSHGATVVPPGDHGIRRIKNIPRDVPIVTDAKDVLFRLDCLRLARRAGNIQGVEFNAFFLGRVSERMGVRPFEPSVRRDNASQAGRRKGSRRAKEKRKETHPHPPWQVLADTALAEDPELKTKIGVARRVAETLGYIPRTCKHYSPDHIARHITVNKSPQ